ncbi:MAG: hypothetical protein KDB53_03885, partial [Planctomycetes bacterium]|nr:hypothetical protein [Planctomycetota bacterium]
DLIELTTEGLVRDLGARLDAADDTRERLTIADWGETVFRSLLVSAGNKVLAEPARYLGVKDKDRGALLTSVGTTIISLATGDSKLDISRIVSREGLDTIVRAVLTTVGENPELLGKIESEGIRTIIAELAVALAQSDDALLSEDILPELIRLVLETTGEHLDLILPTSDPKKHLLLTAARTALAILTAKPDDGAKWKPTFSSDAVLQIVEAVVDEVAAHPGWMLEGAARIDANLEVALRATLDVIRERGDARLGRNVAVAMLKASLLAVALRQEFVRKDLGTGGEHLLAAIFNAVFDFAFAEDTNQVARWQLLRDDALVSITTIILDRVTASEIDDQTTTRLKAFLADKLEQLEGGAPLDWESFEDELDAALSGPLPEEE